MNKDFVTYEQAVQLKELGFNEPCFACYINGYPKSLSIGSVNKKDVFKFLLAPTYSSVFRWFREKHNLFSEIQLDRTTEPKFCFVIFKYEHFGNYEKVVVDEWYLYGTYEEAEQALLCKLIELAIS